MIHLFGSRPGLQDQTFNLFHTVASESEAKKSIQTGAENIFTQNSISRSLKVTHLGSLESR